MVFSYGFYVAFLYLYQSIGYLDYPESNALSHFVDLTYHILETRTMSWMLMIFVPIICIMLFDVSAKVFSNLWYPTQSQIHLEINRCKRLKREIKKGETGTDKPIAEAMVASLDNE